MFVFTGIVFILPCVDNCRKVDMKIKAFKVPPQQVRKVYTGETPRFRYCAEGCG